MRQAQQIQRLKRKYKKITLTGLRVPAPPPHLNIIASLNSQQQQSIQKSNQSEDEQTYYQNYYQKELRKIIEKMLQGVGEQIQWQILDLRETENQFQIQDGERIEQIIDVVIKICIPDERTKNLEENIRNLKQKNEEKSQLKKNKKQKKKKKIEEPNSKNQKRKLKNIQDQFGKASTQASGRNFYSAENLELSNVDIKSGRKGYLDDSEDEDDNNSNSSNKQKKYKAQSKKRAGFYKKLVYFFLFSALFIVAAGAVYSLYFVQQQTRFKKAIQIDLPSSKASYFGNIAEKYKKNKYFVPDSQRISGQTLDAPLIVQYIPPVTKQNESLHPRNISYFRPTQLIVYTYQQEQQDGQQGIQVIKELKKPLSIQLSQTNVELEKKLKEFGNSDQQIMQKLYIELNNPTLETPLLFQLEYYYLSQKYQFLSQITVQRQLPLCIVAYTQESIFQKNQFLPFFKSLFAQNYSNFKLLFLQDGSPDPLNNQRILNYLWKNEKKELERIGKDRFTFITLYSRINQPNAVGSIVRQFCADDDIVVQLNSEDKLLGKQALKLISAKYSNDQNIWAGYSNGLLQMKNSQQKKAYRLNENTTKKETILEQWRHSLIDMSDELSKSHKSFQSLLFKQMQNKPQFPETNYALKLCLKTYKVQLQQKLPYKYFNPSLTTYSNLNFANKINNNFEYFLSLLELSGRFVDQKTDQNSHFMQIDEPLCSKNERNKKVRGCNLGMDEYFEVSRYTKDQFKPLKSLGDQKILIFQNQVKVGDKFRAMIEAFEKQIQNICLKQMSIN